MITYSSEDQAKELFDALKVSQLYRVYFSWSKHSFITMLVVKKTATLVSVIYSDNGMQVDYTLRSFYLEFAKMSTPLPELISDKEVKEC